MKLNFDAEIFTLFALYQLFILFVSCHLFFFCKMHFLVLSDLFGKMMMEQEVLGKIFEVLFSSFLCSLQPTIYTNTF